MTKSISLRIESYSSPDVDIPHTAPDSVERVKFSLELEIGETGTQGTDLFQVVIATPEGLRTTHSGPVIADRATIVVSEYSWALVLQTVEQIVERCAAPTWTESVLKLQRYFQWEYEDYTLEGAD